MDLFKAAETLRNVPLFAKLPASKLKLLAFTSETIAFEDGETLFRAGDAADAAYVVLEGAVDIVIETGAQEVLAGTLAKNELFGELAVLTNSPRTATIRARGHLTALRIRRDVFLQLLCSDPEVSLQVIRELSGKLIRTHRQLEDAERKLQHLARPEGPARG